MIVLKNSTRRFIADRPRHFALPFLQSVITQKGLKEKNLEVRIQKSECRCFSSGSGSWLLDSFCCNAQHSISLLPNAFFLEHFLASWNASLQWNSGIEGHLHENFGDLFLAEAGVEPFAICLSLWQPLHSGECGEVMALRILSSNPGRVHTRRISLR